MTVKIAEDAESFEEFLVRDEISAKVFNYFLESSEPQTRQQICLGAGISMDPLNYQPSVWSELEEMEEESRWEAYVERNMIRETNDNAVFGRNRKKYEPNPDNEYVKSLKESLD